MARMVRRVGAAGHERQHPRAALAFDKEGRFDGARFVLVVSAERRGQGGRVEREVTFLRALAS